jgi:hypothetical protein
MDTTHTGPLVVLPPRFVLIEDGKWPEGQVWRHAPDGRIVVDLHGYVQWAGGQLAAG